MSFSIVDLWRRAKGVFTQPVPKPTPPVPAPAPTEPPTDSGTRIKIERFDRREVVNGKVVEHWTEMPVPLVSSEPLFASKADGRLWRQFRITVLKGRLTFTGVSKSGKNKPAISASVPSGRIMQTGGYFLVACSVGPVTAARSGGHDQANFGVHTKELDQIVQLSAQVMYGQ